MGMFGSTAQLIEWNKQGLIPGPAETEEEFIERTHFCLHIEQELNQMAEAQLPFTTDDQASLDTLQEAHQETIRLFDIHPNWIPLFFNNHHLTAWHGGCAWIFKMTEHTPTAAFLQLRAQFRKQKTYLGLYKRDELIAHEMAHVGRMMYQEPQFEEILAYQTSSFWWRRWLGPIVQSPTESLFFILVLGFILLADLALIALGQEHAYQTAMQLKWIPLILIGFALGRLAWRQWLFYTCLKNLEKIYRDADIARYVTYRLQDAEIRSFANLTSERIQAYIRSQPSFRWEFINKNYPIPFPDSAGKSTSLKAS